MMTKAAEQAIRSGVTAVAATMLALALSPLGAFAAACPPAILKCGCTIGAPGTYTLSGANPILLNSTEGTTCVHIKVSDVILVGGPTLQGPGSKLLRSGFMSIYLPKGLLCSLSRQQTLAREFASMAPTPQSERGSPALTTRHCRQRR
jgi:hypothetical protein